MLTATVVIRTKEMPLALAPESFFTDDTKKPRTSEAFFCVDKERRIEHLSTILAIIKEIFAT